MPDTRQLETMLVAHLVLDPRCLEERTAPELSPAARALVDLVLTEDLRCLLLPGVLTVLRVTRFGCYCHKSNPIIAEPLYVHLLQCTRRARYRDVVRMAQAAERLTIEELSFFSRSMVLSLLGSYPTDSTKPYVPPKKKGERAKAPWKRRRKAA